MNAPPSPMGQAVRQAIADHNAQPAVDRRHLDLLRAAALRLDTAEWEETLLRTQFITSVRLLNQAMALLAPFLETDSQVSDLNAQFIQFARRNKTI